MMTSLRSENTKSQKRVNIFLFCITILAILFIWTLTALIIDNDLILPSIIDTIMAFPKIGAKKLFSAVFNTLLRSVIAFCVSYILAFILALLSYRYRVAKGIISPVIAIIRALPTVAVVLLLVLWVNSKIAPVVVTGLVVIPTIYTNILNAFNNFNRDLLEMAKVFEIDKKDTLNKIIIPQIAPDLLMSLGSGLSLNLKLMVAAEVLSETANCLGYLMSVSKAFLETAEMIALVLIAVFLGLIIELLFNGISKKVGEWR